MYRLVLIICVLISCNLVQSFAESGEIKRERTEWCDIWIAFANQHEKPRILFVGDSITKDYYGPVAKRLSETAYCAKFATSACVADPAFHLQLNTILSQYDWDVIHFNNGLHGFGYSDEEYRAGYQKALEVVKKYASSAKMVLALTTPVKSPGEAQNLNPRVKKRNLIAAELAKQFGAQIDDLYSVSEGHPEYYRDSHHYKPEAVTLQSEQVVTVINQVLGLSDGILNVAKEEAVQ